LSSTHLSDRLMPDDHDARESPGLVYCGVLLRTRGFLIAAIQIHAVQLNPGASD